MTSSSGNSCSDKLNRNKSRIYLEMIITEAFESEQSGFFPMLAADFSKLHINYAIRLEGERLYLSQSEMMHDWKQSDTKKCTSAKTSKMTLLNDKVVFVIGDEIRVNIDTYDSHGNKKNCGGDFLRLWMEDKRLGASVAGHVIDHNNGSYTGVIRALWEGAASIRCFIERRKEEIAMFYDILEKNHALWVPKREFVSNGFVESTECSIKPDNFQSYCNFTDMNYGFPWFCARPNKLKCEDWKNSWSENRGYPPDDPYQRSIYYLSVKGNDDDLPTKIHITVVYKNTLKDLQLSRPTTPCNRLPPEMTWRMVSPVGLFFGGAFQPTLCLDNLSLTPKTYRRCLKNKRLWLHGDSTSQQFKRSLHYTLGIPDVSTGHNPQLLTDKEDNFSVSWYAHEFPFFHGAERFAPTVNKPQHLLLDSLPDNTEDIVVLYIYVHFNLVHPDVYREHIRVMVRSVGKLLSRAPKVTIAVRGPHAYYRSFAQELVSYWGLIYSDILRKEFAPFADRVVYLDFWDLTVAVGPEHVHPDMIIVKSMIFLADRC
ncbi:NXPE family member 4-like [Haliotis rubra]|uniref:NXPE family member 4-like n=1 Tax=Haliotis rubra TaxID=36100 RepID=UPI001EE5065C|nr:NXPE family member 4-like [Haliotis rubra]